MSSQPEQTNHNPSINAKQLQSLKTTQLKSLKSMLEGPNAEDDSIIDLQYEKNLNTVNYDKMKLSVQKSHATKENGEYYNCKEACWSFNPGSHYIVKSSEKSDVTKFGVGIMLYFKFVKHLILFFLLFTILSIPAFVFYISSFSTYNTGSNSSVSYVDILTATTLGSIGLGSTSCAVARFPSDSSITTTSLTFQCTSGTIASVDKMIYGLVTMGTTCSFIDETDLTTSCNTYDSTSLSKVFTDVCVGQTYCTIKLTDTQGLFYNSGDCSSLLSKMNAYVRVNCEYDTITVANNSVSKSAVSIIVAAFDAAIIVIFIIMIVTLKYAQKNAIKSAQQKAYSASSYTIELKNLPQDLPAEELAAKLWAYLDGKLGEKSIETGHRVVDIQIVLPNKLIEYSKDVGTIIHTKNTMIREFIQTYLPDYAKTQIDINELQKVMQSMIQQNHPKVKEAEKLFRKIKTLSEKKMKLLLEIQKLKTTKHVRIVSAFVTFSSIPARNKILDAFISTPFERFSRALCGSKSQDNLFEGKILRAKSAADPGSILWENIGEPGGKVFMRRALSLAITVALWVITAVILIVSTYYKNYFKKKFPSVDCSMSDNSTEDLTTIANDYNLGDYQVGLVECYCSDDLVGRLYTTFPLANDETLCLTWFTNKVIETSVTFGIVFTVLVINYGVQFVFQGLSRFEKHSTLNKQLATRVIKTFAAQFLNTGLLILLVNTKIDDASFWQGQFRDLSPLWYINVGSTLLSTMFINVVTVPTVKIVSVIFNRLARCYDRGCKKDPRLTKKKNQKSYEELYSGPEFIVDFRYSQILTLAFVCFLYSGPMPLLYFSSLLQLVITYFFDKVVLLRISKLPKNYDESLEYVVRPTLYVILILHLLIAIFGFGNSQIFQETSNSVSDVGGSVSDTISTNSQNVVIRFFKRTVMTQNIVLLVLLIIVVAGFLFKGVLYGLFKRTILAAFRNDEEKSDKKGIKVAPGDISHYSFFHVIKTQDLATLIKLTKVTIKSTQNPDLINHLKSKLSLLQQEYQVKQKADPHPINFIGFYSYDVRVQESYSAQFAIAEMIDDETLE